jgi:hypothetical protein
METPTAVIGDVHSRLKSHRLVVTNERPLYVVVTLAMRVKPLLQLTPMGTHEVGVLRPDLGW